ncbi:MAG TPA: helix-turn-helix domain-containing protein [Anaerolineales bacterium]|nr:helix-turn-helix domain-containing protein [Anaerolineales bacterium]
MTTIGNRFREQRIAKNITIKVAQTDTHLRAIVINALENEDFNHFHSFAQLRGFAKIYAEYLGIYSSDLMVDLKVAYELAKPPVLPIKSETKSVEPPAIPAVANGDLLEYKQIYQQIANMFSERRSKIGVTLQDVEWHSHIRKSVLERIESGNFDDFGSPIQAKGMLIHYARFLELDTETIETLFGEALLKKRTKSVQSVGRPKSIEGKSLIRMLGFFTWDVFVIAGVIVFALGLLIWAVNRFLSDQEIPIASAETLSVSDVILEDSFTPQAAQPVDFFPETSPTAAPAEELIVEISQEAPTQEALGNVNVTVIILEKAFLRVLVDGEEKLNTRGIAGNVLEFNGDEEVQVLTGSGSSIKVIYNGQDLGTLGQYGEPVLRIFSIKGIITPTPSITPSPTITLTPSITPRPTLTPIPSATPRPTSTTAP